MREILFKAKGYNTDKWYYGLLSGINPSACSIKQNDGYGRICDTKTLCQYTGLTDKNGQKIWENDIVRAWSAGECAVGKIKRRIDGLWIIYPAWQKNEIWHLIPNENGETAVEVIGNVFGNPELLKGGAEQ